MKSMLTWASTIVLAIGMSGAAVAQSGNKYGATEAADTQPDIVDTAAAAGNFETLLAAAKAAGLAEALKGEGPFTVFAPTDEAFAALGEEKIAALLDNPAKLGAILKYHVVPGKVMAADVVKVDSATTLLGQSLPVSTEGGVQVGTASVTATDITASNGVIHVIDSVLVPADIVDIAAGNEDFETLVAAVKAAGLVETLKGDGPFTVFAPTDAAFAALPEGTVEELLKPENKEQLVAVLTYHVVPGTVTAADVVGVDSAETVQGGSIDVTVEKDGDTVSAVKVDNATVVATDIMALNGVIHVIDAVLLPEAK